MFLFHQTLLPRIPKINYAFVQYVRYTKKANKGEKEATTYGDVSPLLQFACLLRSQLSQVEKLRRTESVDRMGKHEMNK
jgi:hypothetical protein